MSDDLRSETDSDLVVIAVIWTLILILLVYKLYRRYTRKRFVETVVQKGLSKTQIRAEQPKYRLALIFSTPTHDFKLNGTDITLDILTSTTGSKKKFKTVSVVINSSRLEVNDYLCCLKNYRYFIESVRKKSFPPITQIRAKHNGDGGKT